MTSDTSEKILDAALSVFCEKGYGACVDDIARRAGVVKQTLYHHFGSKDELFRQALQGLADELLVDLARRSGDLREDLLRFAAFYRSKTFGEQGFALQRMIAAESQRFPDLARTVYEAGMLPAWRGLAALLGEAMQRGELRRDDPDFAADMLLSMLSGQERSRRLFGVVAPGDNVADRAERIVDCFLRAYAPASAPERVKGNKK